MKGLILRRYALSSCIAAAMFAGCGGSQPPIGAPGAVHADGSKSWMLPRASDENLLYISTRPKTSRAEVLVYTYPEGILVGTLTGFSAPEGECVDVAGDVFITDSATSTIVEYAHGGTTPIATLNDYGDFPNGCSVDPTTGNLAVTNYLGTVGIYEDAKGDPARFYDPGLPHAAFCGYDSTGNLFVDGTGASRHAPPFRFAELPKGGEALVNIKLHFSRAHPRIHSPGGVQWDGQHVAVGEAFSRLGKPMVYLTNGSGGEIVASVPLRAATVVFQFWIENKTLIASGEFNQQGRVLFYRYPPKGNPTKIINGQPGAAVGAVVSVASGR
jgi:hypothetical protein